MVDPMVSEQVKRMMVSLENIVDTDCRRNKCMLSFYKKSEEPRIQSIRNAEQTTRVFFSRNLGTIRILRKTKLSSTAVFFLIPPVPVVNYICCVLRKLINRKYNMIQVYQKY